MAKAKKITPIGLTIKNEKLPPTVSFSVRGGGDVSFVDKLKKLEDDPRRRRFHRALTWTVPILTPDEVDKIMPILLQALARDYLEKNVP